MCSNLSQNPPNSPVAACINNDTRGIENSPHPELGLGGGCFV
jgi:hypothetical protein